MDRFKNNQYLIIIFQLFFLIFSEQSFAVAGGAEDKVRGLEAEMIYNPRINPYNNSVSPSSSLDRSTSAASSTSDGDVLIHPQDTPEKQSPRSPSRLDSSFSGSDIDSVDLVEDDHLHRIPSGILEYQRPREDNFTGDSSATKSPAHHSTGGDSVQSGDSDKLFTRKSGGQRPNFYINQLDPKSQVRQPSQLRELPVGFNDEERITGGLEENLKPNKAAGTGPIQVKPIDDPDPDPDEQRTSQNKVRKGKETGIKRNTLFGDPEPSRVDPSSIKYLGDQSVDSSKSIAQPIEGIGKSRLGDRRKPKDAFGEPPRGSQQGKSIETPETEGLVGKKPELLFEQRLRRPNLPPPATREKISNFDSPTDSQKSSDSSNVENSKGKGNPTLIHEDAATKPTAPNPKNALYDDLRDFQNGLNLKDTPRGTPPNTSPDTPPAAQPIEEINRSPSRNLTKPKDAIGQIPEETQQGRPLEKSGQKGTVRKKPELLFERRFKSPDLPPLAREEIPQPDSLDSPRSPDLSTGKRSFTEKKRGDPNTIRVGEAPKQTAPKTPPEDPSTTTPVNDESPVNDKAKRKTRKKPKPANNNPEAPIDRGIASVEGKVPAAGTASQTRQRWQPSKPLAEIFEQKQGADADAGTPGTTPNAGTPGTTPDAGTPGTTPDAGKTPGATPDAGKALNKKKKKNLAGKTPGTTPDAGTPGTTPDAGKTPGTTPDAGKTPGTTPDAGSPGTTPDGGTPGTTPDAGKTPGTTPDAGTPGTTPDAGTPGTTPDAGKTPGTTPDAGKTPGTTPDAGTPGTTPDAGTPGTTPDAGTPDRKSTRLNSSHEIPSRMPSSA